MDFLEKKYTLQEYEQLLDQSITDRNGIFFWRNDKNGIC
jgi:hypothetical protein